MNISTLSTMTMVNEWMLNVKIMATGFPRSRSHGPLERPSLLSIYTEIDLYFCFSNQYLLVINKIA